MVKNPPAMQDTWVRSLSWEEPLEKGMAIHSSILSWGIYCLFFFFFKGTVFLFSFSIS